ncbi:MAG: hypothetical protein K5888_09425 [Lachnospiraceae bacterium]|nr:hypothetical protein [Lachnospiraceae bacterium]
MTGQEKNGKKYTIWDILPYIWLGAGVLLMLIYHIGPGKYLVDGDMAGEMILADLLNKEHDFLLSDNWYQATEIHVFFMQIIFRPILLIWPNNWHMVRVVSMVIIYAINLAGYFFMMKQTGIKRPAVWSAGALMWPMGMWRLFLGLYGGQYLVYDFFTFYILGLILYLYNNFCPIKGLRDNTISVDAAASKEKGGFAVGYIIAAVILAFLSFAGGANGVRETMMLFMPICLGVVIVIIRHLFAKKDMTSWKEVFESEKPLARLFSWIAFATFFNLAGYGFNLTYLMKRYTFQKNTDMVWAESFSFKAVLDSMAQFFGLFGYEGDTEFFSIAGICSAAGIVLALVIIFVIVRLFVNQEKLNLVQEIIFMTFVSGMIACSFVFGLMESMNEPRFWTPFMCFGIMLFELEWETEEVGIPNLKRIIALLVSLCIIVASFGTVKSELESPHRGKSKYKTLATFLEENNYTQGYALFWIANPVTELTSGRVVVRPLIYMDSFEMMAWSNRVDYVNSYPEGDVFVVFDKKGYPGDPHDGYAYKYGNGNAVLDDDDWLVVMFSDAADIEAAYKEALENGDAIDKATRIASMQQ